MTVTNVKKTRGRWPIGLTDERMEARTHGHTDNKMDRNGWTCV